MKKILSIILAVIMMLTALYGSFAVSAESGSSSLGASAACPAHILGSFSGVPACINEDGDLHICENNFPDENFRKYVTEEYDWEWIGYLTEKECMDVTNINVSNQNISALQGIEYFAGIVYLSCNWNNLIKLNLCKNIALETLEFIGNPIETIDLRKNPELKILKCDSAQLTELDISRNIHLTELWCSGNQLTKLDISNNKAMIKLNCDGNLLTELDIRNNGALRYLFCSHNQLSELNVNNNSALEYLACTDNELTELDVRNNLALNSLSCSLNQLKRLDVSNNLALEGLECSDNQINELDVSKHTALLWLYCANNRLTKLDVSNSLYLNVLDCSNNNMTELFTNNYNGVWYQLEVSPQTVELPLFQENGVWMADLSLLIPVENLTRIDSVSEGKFNVNTGIVAFADKPEMFTYDCYIGKVKKSMHVDVRFVDPIFYKARINGVEFEYIAGQKIDLSADVFYIDKGWGYRFGSWTGDVAGCIADINSNLTSMTMPEQDITINTKYTLIGDIDENGELSSADALYIIRMAGGNIPETAAGDITGDGIISANDVVYMRRYLVGNYIPEK